MIYSRHCIITSQRQANFNTPSVEISSLTIMIRVLDSEVAGILPTVVVG